MFSFLKKIFSQERVNAEVNERISHIFAETDQKINSKRDTVTKRKIQSLALLNNELNNAADEMKQVSFDLINKLNNQVEGLTTQLKSISDASSDGIITLDWSGKIINLNHAVELMFGYPFSELTGKDICNIIPVCGSEYDSTTHNFCEIMQSVSQNIFNNLKYKGGNFNIDNYFSLSKTNRKIVGTTKTGMHIILEMNVNIINPGVTSAEKIQYICIMKDITELTKSKQDIEELVNFQLSLVEAVPNAVYWKDKDLRYLGCNSEFENISGFKRKEIVGKTLAELTLEAEKRTENADQFFYDERDKLVAGEDALKALIQKNVDDGLPIENIKRVPIKNKLYNVVNKTYIDVIIYRTILVNELGEFDGLVCSIMDISKLVKEGIITTPA